MTIKLRGSTDGSVSLTAPADTSPSGTDITLTLPIDTGSANQFLKNSGTAGTLDYSSMVETSTGVGIGTASPSYKLDVNGSAQIRVGESLHFQNVAGSGIASIQCAGAGTNTDLTFKTATTERFRIHHSGYITVDGPTNYSNIQFKANGTVRGYVGPAGFIGGSDTDFGMRAESGGAIVLYCGSAEKARLNSGGNFLVGTSTADGFKFKVTNGAGTLARFTDGTSQTLDIRQAVGGIELQNPNNGFISFKGSSAERMRVDNSGRVLLNTSSSIASEPGEAHNPILQVAHVSGNVGNLGISVSRFQANNPNSVPIILQKSRNSTIGSHGIVHNDDELGRIEFAGSDGSNFRTAAAISAQVDGTPGSSDMPGRLIFKTTADGANSPTEHMRITSSGYITNKNSFIDNLPASGFTLTDYRMTITGQTTSTTTTPALRISRDTYDGELVSFHQDSTQEGSISVSGNTISYNGGHLSRWSQTLTTDEHVGLLKGTVMTNLDEMCEWPLEARDEVLWTEQDKLPEGVSVGDVRFPARAAGFEDNEQLNKMAVSSVEGDPNVAGVIVNIDSDDDLNVAMTGDFIIRVAQGTTVARGDLLMSAGDGTAKPQDDDIVRSKTIAKVTSTNVTCTYDDGSYCVPCVLMAC